MLHINRKAFLRTLAKEYMRANKLRNIVATIAIALTTAMFSSVVVIYEGSQAAIQKQMLYQSGNRFMLQIRDIPKGKSVGMKTDPVFTEIYEVDYLGSAASKNTSLPVSLKYAEQGYLDGAYIHYTSGGYPDGGNRIAVPERFLKQAGWEVSVGDQVDLDYTVNGKPCQDKAVIAGIYEGHPNETELTIYVSKAFFDKRMQEIQPVLENGGKAGSVSLFGNFEDTSRLLKKEKQVLARAGFDLDAAYGEAGYVDASLNIAYQMQTEPAPQEKRLFFAVAMVILCAGFFIIFNVFQISVAKDIRIYGQLKTVGASVKQLRKLVEYQAIQMAVIGIPAGIVCGWGLGNLALPMMMSTTTYKESMLIMPDVRIIVACVLFSALTVWVSCEIPAIAISRLSPVQALQYLGKEKSRGRKIKKGKESRHRILHMAAANLLQGGARTLLVTVSLALSMALFSSILNFTSTFDKKTYMQGQAGAEFNVYNPAFCAGTRLLFDDTDALPAEVAERIGQMDGIRNGGFVYFHGRPMDVPESALRDDYNGIVTAKIMEVNGQAYANDPVQEVGQALYGFDDPVLQRATVIEGALDFEKLKSGGYMVEAIIADENGEGYSPEMLSVHVGDKVSAEIEGRQLSYEVMACVSVNSKLIAPAQPGEASFIVLPSSEFLRLFPDKQPVRFLCDAKPGRYGSVKSYFGSLAGAGVSCESSKSIETEFEVFRGVYQMAGNVSAAVFGIMGLLNLLNVMVVSAATRQRELAVMQSIGMTKKQLHRMFLLEGVGYVVLASLFECLASAVVSITAIQNMARRLWYCSYHFDMMPAVGIVIPYLLGAVVISAGVHKIWDHGTVVEKLRMPV